MSITVRTPYLAVHIPPSGAGSVTVPRNVATAGVITTASPVSTSRGPGTYYCQIMTLSLVSGQYTSIELSSMTFDEYVYLRRPDGTLFSQADTPGFYTFTPDATGNWTYEVTTFSAGVTGTFTILWNRVPLESDLAFTSPGSYPYLIQDGWLTPAALGSAFAAWFKLNQATSGLATMTVDITLETNDDYLYLTNNSLGIVTQSDTPPFTSSVSPGVYFAICKNANNSRTGSATFVYSFSPTDYGNPKGKGNRTSVITATTSAGLFNSGTVNSLINGNTGNEADFTNAAAAGKFLQFDFAQNYVIDEFKWYGSGIVNHGTWKMQASPDGSSWVDIGASFTLGPSTQTYPVGGNTAYRYWQLLGVSGNTSNNPWVNEIEFKISVAMP